MRISETDFHIGLGANVTQRLRPRPGQKLLLSRPHKWCGRLEHVGRTLKVSRKKLQRIFRELIGAGYIRNSRRRHRICEHPDRKHPRLSRRECSLDVGGIACELAEPPAKLLQASLLRRFLHLFAEVALAD